MVPGGKILSPDVVAISILDLPLVNIGFAYYVVEITGGSAVGDSPTYQYFRCMYLSRRWFYIAENKLLYIY